MKRERLRREGRREKRWGEKGRGRIVNEGTSSREGGEVRQGGGEGGLIFKGGEGVERVRS